MPSYTCGQPRSVGLARLAADARLALPCAEVTLVSELEADALIFSFGPECSFRAHTLTGRAVFRLSAGDERFDVSGDFQETVLDGDPLMLAGGYGECGDEKRYWVRGTRAFETSVTERFSIDVHLAQRDGLPLIGDSIWLLTGPAELIHPESRDAISLPNDEETRGCHHQKAPFARAPHRKPLMVYKNFWNVASSSSQFPSRWSHPIPKCQIKLGS